MIEEYFEFKHDTSSLNVRQRRLKSLMPKSNRAFPQDFFAVNSSHTDTIVTNISSGSEGRLSINLDPHTIPIALGQGAISRQKDLKLEKSRADSSHLYFRDTDKTRSTQLAKRCHTDVLEKPRIPQAPKSDRTLQTANSQPSYTRPLFRHSMEPHRLRMSLEAARRSSSKFFTDRVAEVSQISQKISTEELLTTQQNQTYNKNDYLAYTDRDLVSFRGNQNFF